MLVQHFNRDFASLSPEQFIQRILVEGCRARWLAVGDDFRFGAARAGDVAMLRSAGEGGGFTIEQIAPVLVGGERVSSSRIRAALSEGDLALAGDRHHYHGHQPDQRGYFFVLPLGRHGRDQYFHYAWLEHSAGTWGRSDLRRLVVEL